MAWKECVICGAGFDGRGPQKCCSKSCMRENRNNNQSKNVEKRCSECGCLFLRINRGLTCGPKCSLVRRNRLKIKYDNNIVNRKRKNKLRKQSRVSMKVDRKCKECGKYFLGETNSITCSEYCRSIRFDKTQTKAGIMKYIKTEPPADLVEEATALRLLNRALREIT